jgi:Pentapeptide repeats (8 copies)
VKDNKLFKKIKTNRFIILLFIVIIWLLSPFFGAVIQQNNLNHLNKKIISLSEEIEKNKTDHKNRLEILKLKKDVLALEKDKTTLFNSISANVLQSLSQLLGAAVIGFTAYVGYQNFRVGEKSLRTLEDKNVTERFSKSIEHLGNGAIDIQLGGIYALEQIAIDSPTKYQWIVVEILSAFVREKSLIDSPDEPSGNPGKGSYKKETIAIHAALNVIGLGLKKIKQDPPGKKVNLRRVNFLKIELENAQLNSANLSESNLSHSNLSHSNLSHSNLNGANLSRANLNGANLNGANLSKCNLSRANLNGANLLATENFTQQQLNSAIYDEETKLPDHLSGNFD